MAKCAVSVCEDTLSSEELEDSLTEYVLKIQELSHLIHPESGNTSSKSIETAMKRVAKSLIKQTESHSFDASKLYSTIKSGIKLIKETIGELEKHSYQAPDTLPEVVLRSLKPGWIQHDGNMNTLFKQCSEEIKEYFIISEPPLTKIIRAMGIFSLASDSDCETCARLRDSDYWKLERSRKVRTLEDVIYKYSVSSAAGQYECSGTGLRWRCVSNVSLTCQIIDWESFREDFERNGYTPCGPLLDITVTSGTLEEVYLPHVLCLGDASFPDDAVKVLHVDDSGVSFENCQVTKFHAKLLKPTFSLKGVLIKTGFPVKAHCEILIHRTLSAHLKLHIYLFPRDPKMKEAVEKEEACKSVKIRKPRPERSLQMKNWFRLRTLENLKRSECPSEITPEKLKLSYTSTPNFFEVYFKDAKNSFFLQLINEEDKVLWDVPIREDDLGQISSIRQENTTQRHVRSTYGVEFVNKHRKDLIEKVSLVFPIADDLKPEIGDHKYSIIKTTKTPQSQMRTLLDFLTADCLKEKLYQSLLKYEEYLVKELKGSE